VGLRLLLFGLIVVLLGFLVVCCIGCKRVDSIVSGVLCSIAHRLRLGFLCMLVCSSFVQ